MDFKGDVFQRKVLRVEKQRRKMKKKRKGKEMQHDRVTYQMDFIKHACRIHGGIRRK